MRIAFSIPTNQEYFYSGYPSEPLLAEAAARQMDEFQTLVSDADTNVMVNILESEFKSGLLDQEQRREIVFRQLISEAYRRAIRKDYPHHSQPNFSRGCKLTTFITELFSKDYAHQILNSVPDNVKSSITFSTAFKDAVVRFTHFGKATDDSGTTTHAMFAAFVRCMAFICRSSHNIVDILVPVLLKREKMLEESVMTGLLIRVKGRKTRSAKIDQRALEFFPAPPSSTGDIRPYITLVAEVGVQVQTTPATVTEIEVGERLAGSSLTLLAPPLKASRKPTADVHPRYSIFACGCSNTVYNVISHSDRPVYKFLLANRDMFDEHPRKNEESLSAARKMRPFWNGDFEWIEKDLLRKDRNWRDDEGGLFVGKYEVDTVGETA
jgi:hypothetical protein